MAVLVVAPVVAPVVVPAMLVVPDVHSFALVMKTPSAVEIIFPPMIPIIAIPIIAIIPFCGLRELGYQEQCEPETNSGYIQFAVHRLTLSIRFLTQQVSG